jgi:hypothetical protein
MNKIIKIIALALVFNSLLVAQALEKTILEKRADDSFKVLKEPKDLDSFFTSEFLAQVPPAQIKEISDQLKAQHGKPLKVQKIDKKNDYEAVISILFEKGVVLNLNLVVEPTGKNLISGLIISSVEKVSSSLNDIVSELQKLPGTTSLAVARLKGNDFELLASHNPEKHFAIGSTFKLYILAELVRQISGGQRKWSDTVELKNFSLPSGQMQNWPEGSPVTLHTLASLMISISDNTATDQLLRTLGRENLEKMLKTAGNSKPELTIPFLTTAEMFMLKGLAKQEYAKKYVVADEKGIREILNNQIAKSNPGDINPVGFLVKPTFINEIEWFASPLDLVRLMNWLRLNSEKAPLDKAFGVMTINKALNPDVSKEWKYVGYKGGSETGVISMTFLLQSKAGDWYVVTSNWNNEKEALNQNEFILLVQTAVKNLQKQLKSKK